MENLPKNWVQTEFKELISFVIGGDWGKDLEFEFDVESEVVLCVRGSEIKNWEKDKGSTSSLRKVKISSLEKRALIEGDILIEISGGGPDQPVGRTVFIDEEALNVNSEYKKVCTNFLRMVRLYDNLDKKFIKNYLDSFYLSGEVLKYQGGSNNLRNLKFKEFETIQIPLPPLAEQQRIVAKLDGLFGHLDSLKQRLELIPTLLKQFRQSVLTQAVTGKLTEEWRGSKSVVIDSPITIGDEFQEKPKNWIWCNLIDIAKLESGHTPRKSKEEYWINGDVPWISLQDIRAAHGTIITDTKYKPNMVGINNSSARLLPKGTVCFSRDISVGYTTIMGKEMATTQHFANWICREKLFNKYLLYAFISAKDFLIASGRGTTVKTIYMPALKQFRLLLPPIEEQTEIINSIENLFAKADKIEVQFKQLKEKIDSLPQAILAKAFKGELVEQLPTDGDAKDLLKEIAALRASLEKEKKSKKKQKINA